MQDSISKKNITNFTKEFNSCSSNKISRNALTRTQINNIAMDWDAFRLTNHIYSDVISTEMTKVTNQKSSGRCWGFAGLNLMRISLAEKYNLKDFEFSQNYFMFFDKLEKSNYFLENIIKTLDESYDSRLMMHLLHSPVQDGGQWDMFVNLIEKYGVVPQSAMPESFQSSQSGMMNRFLTRKLREFASTLRKMNKKGINIKALRTEKKKMMSEIYTMLCICLGNPPEKFDWQTRDKKNKFVRLTDLNPIDFYNKHSGVKLKDKICLIHAPMSNKKMNELYTVSFLGNVVGGQIIKYANVEIDEIKKAAIKSIKNNESVWFGCDVGKMFHRDLGLMDMDLYDYEALLGTKFGMNKATRLEYGDSMMTHAMLFTGVDIANGKSTKWRVENSWGPKGGNKGYYLMTDKWFDEYNYEIVVDKKYLPKQILDLFNRKPVELAPWDPMGALAIK
ncbi:C1 family peptidase [Candidatus Marinimicrobia bacterium]|jgi:bleomycin hydrolase|nr:C1 family peptidase [Candidatus Neomarinimicrobiota bacterium]|tara:strand:- start:357 stop:1700 length:1344 start_codon:yes stop_codon:yes gene_type:complete